MDRTFHHRISIGELSGIILFAALALFFLLKARAVPAIIGASLMVLAVVQIERAIHTTYTLTADGWLIVCRGRFSRIERIRISDIIKCTKIRLMGGLVRYIIVRYGSDHAVSLQPDNEDGMISAIRKYQND